MANYYVYQFKKDIQSNWEEANTVLRAAEPGFDLTNKRLKMGDGTTPWKALPYVDPDIVDDLTTGGSDKTLSAEQGKRLKELIENNKGLREPFLTLSNYEIATNAGVTTEITANYRGSGVLSVLSSDENIATASISGRTITINHLSVSDEALITVKLSSDGIYFEDDVTSVVTYPIGENPELTLSETEVAFPTTTTKTITATWLGSGTLSAQSSDATIATVLVSGKNIIISRKTAEAAVITVNLSANGDYRASKATINVAEGDNPNLTLSASTIYSGTITASFNGSGTITAVSNDTNIATVSVNGKNITVTHATGMHATENTTITVLLSASQGYYAATATINVIATLEAYSWGEIQAIGAAGVGEQYFDIGDMKSVKLSGGVGTLSLNDTFYVYIIDFNYRDDPGIYFQGFKTANGIDIALCDSKYSLFIGDGTKYFNIFHWGGLENSGGWKSTDLRYDILGSTNIAPSRYGTSNETGDKAHIGFDATTAAKTSPVANTLMAALPSDLRDALAPWTVYTDNVAAAPHSISDITASIDYLPLLSEFEVTGKTEFSNPYEETYQRQMAYYKNGNTLVKRKHNDMSIKCAWLLRSPFYTSNGYAAIDSFGEAFAPGENTPSYGLAPAFRVA